MTNDDKKDAHALWGGRFTGAVDARMAAFNASVGVDARLAQADVRGSLAQVAALERVSLASGGSLMPPSDAAALTAALTAARSEWDAGAFALAPGDEDVHAANERRVAGIAGAAAAGRLHAGRSRNDQVATDMRLWLLEQVPRIRVRLAALIAVAADRAAADIDALMPGYTHLQRAQPIRWSHLVLSHAWAWRYDAARIDDLIPRISVLPLGSGALAGSPFPVDRTRIAADLGFASISQNSIHAVADRDFLAELLFVVSLTMIHLSRWAEDLIIYCSAEFGFLRLDDAFSTGSSLMPQKKNPDSLELIRGKAGRAFGNLAGFLMTYKSLPSSYNKDLQEDKEPMFDSVDTLSACLEIATGVLSTLKIDSDRMRACLTTDMLATDLAEYLVRKGVPFRETHHISGRAVKLAEATQMPLSALTLEQLKSLHPAFEADVSDVWDFERSVEQRSVPGGTSRESVLEQINQLRSFAKA